MATDQCCCFPIVARRTKLNETATNCLDTNKEARSKCLLYKQNLSCLTKYKVVLSKLCVSDLLVECGTVIKVYIGQIPCTKHGLLHLRNSTTKQHIKHKLIAAQCYFIRYRPLA